MDMHLFSPSRLSVKQGREGLRGGGNFLTTPRGNSNAYLTSYFPRAVALFNSLDPDVRAQLVPH